MCDWRRADNHNAASISHNAFACLWTVECWSNGTSNWPSKPSSKRCRQGIHRHNNRGRRIWCRRGEWYTEKMVRTIFLSVSFSFSSKFQFSSCGNWLRPVFIKKIGQKGDEKVSWNLFPYNWMDIRKWKLPLQTLPFILNFEFDRGSNANSELGTMNFAAHKNNNL